VSEPEERFEFDFEDRWRPLLRVLGVSPDNAEVLRTPDDRLLVRFGRWSLETPLANVTGLQESGGYHWYKAIGARGSFADRGVTFGTTTEHGVCLLFAVPVPSLIGPLVHHPGMTVTVADPAGFVAEVRRRTGLSSPADPGPG